LSGDPWAGYQVAGAPTNSAAPASDDPWSGYKPAKTATPAPVLPAPTGPLAPTGAAHDGDTFALTGGGNARLLGVDAFELNQTGRSPTGAIVPLGQQARTRALPFYQPGATVTPTGASTYGRPVATVQNGGDPGEALLHDGLALAEPKYLANDPARLFAYVQAERLARLNRRGAHADTFQTPSSFRHGSVDPVANPDQARQDTGNDAIFWDDPTPAAGLPPKVADGYVAIWQDMNSQPSDLLAYAKANGFQLDPKDVVARYAARAKTKSPGSDISYQNAPRVLTDMKDGAFGATLRGFADPFNVLDETGAVVDSLLPGSERENVWSSNRRFGDVYANNLEQNRDILGFDDAQHPYARFGGQLVGGLVVPGASVEGVGYAAARAALRDGATRIAAKAAARRAVLNRLAVAGAVEGGAAGAGAGETWQDRATGAIVGAPSGAVLGGLTGVAAPKIAELVGRPFSKLAGREGEANAQALTDGALDAGKAGAQNAAGATAAARQTDRLDLSAPPVRGRDRIDVGPGARPVAEPSGSPFDTSAPVRPAPTPRSFDDVMPEVEQWARERGVGTDPSVMVHGSPRADITEFDPYGRSGYGLFGAGTYLTDTARIGAEYTGKGLSKAARETQAERTLYAVRQSVKNPLDMDAPADRATWEAAARRTMGDWGSDYFDDLPADATNERMWREVEDMLSSDQVPASEGQETMDSLVRALGHDGITHIGGGRVNKDGTRHRVVIALDPEQTEIFDRLSIGSLMTPKGPRSPDWIDANASVRSGRQRDRLAMPETASMRAEADPIMYGPDLTQPRTPDRIDVNARPRLLTADPTEAQRAARAAGVQPRDVLPLPSNTVDGIAEAERIGAGRYETVRAPNENDTLEARAIPSPRDGSRMLPKRGPLDLVTWLRTQGGLKPMGGTLEHLSITNASRDLDFARGESRFGKLVSEDGKSADIAAHDAWEAGFFPDHTEPPSVSEFLDALEATYTGHNRVYRPDDFEEVDRFEAARRQRWDVEKAQLEGAPLVNDRSEPVDLADLERNTPPVTAYEEWGENAPNLAGNIRLDKLDSPQAIKRALAVTDQKVGGFDAAKRGRITQAETEALASDLGMTADDLAKRRKGEAFNAEQALAARQILARSATDLVNLAKRVSRTQNPGDGLEGAFREAWLRHAAIQEQVAGMTAEAGRALAQFRQVADARAVGRVLPDLGTLTGGAARLKDVAGRIVDLEKVGQTGGVSRYALKTARNPTKGDMAAEYYINALLSGPQTHATNILSNTLTAVLQIPEHAVAAGVGLARRGVEKVASRVTGRDLNNADRVIFSEVGGRTIGLMQGTKEGLREAVRSFRTGDSLDGMTKLENQQMNAIPGKAGELIRIPTRLLSAEDELFKGMARRMELTGLAMRKASAEGLRGEAARIRVGDLLSNPTDEMLDQARDYSRYLTFQNPLGETARHIAAFANSHPVLKLLIPFVRTPTNLLKFALERSPAAPLLGEWRREVLAGGARRDVALARALVGTGISAMLLEAAANGHITGGGPADDGAKRVMLANGWQPYSIKIGDRYYSYRRLDPLSTTIGTVADIVDLGSHMTDREREKSGLLVTAAVLNNLASKTWLTGISGFAEALSDPERNWQDFYSRTVAGIATPAIVAQVARITDPILREARGPMDRIRSRVPGLSDDLMPRRDVLGRPVVSEGGLGPDIISPIWTGTARNDPTLSALLSSDVSISPPQRSYTVGGKRVDWTPTQYDRLQQLTGEMAKPALDALVQRGWDGATGDDRQKLVGDIMQKARKAAKGEVLADAPGMGRMFAAPLKKAGDPWAAYAQAQ
jgi:endonuclease YncB( thermonuclease family)